MKDMFLGRRIIAVLIIITALLHLNSAYIWIKVVWDLGKYDGFALTLMMLGIVFVMLNIIAAYGLFTLRKWGYGVAYAAIVYSSLIFKAGYLPFFDYLFPEDYVNYANLLGNIGILTLLISMQMAEFEPKPRKRKKRK